MIFHTEYNNKTISVEYYKNYIVRWAKTKIILAKFNTTDKILDDYLQKEYKIPLKLACLRILVNTNFMTDYAGNIIGKIKDKNLDRIARIITYGTCKVQGSRLLRLAMTL